MVPGVDRKPMNNGIPSQPTKSRMRTMGYEIALVLVFLIQDLKILRFINGFQIGR